MKPMVPHFRGGGNITHWSEFPGFGDTPYQRECELSYRAGFGWAAGELLTIDGERCETLIAKIEDARDILCRKGPFRGFGLDLTGYHYLTRFVLAAHLRGQSHGLQCGRNLLDSPYELRVWCDAVADWSVGDPDCFELPPASLVEHVPPVSAAMIGGVN